MNKSIPPFLYHYTSIEVLALILRNRTIRFRRLDLLDDPDEGVSSDFGRQGKYVMISCWTSEPEEELLIWSLYTKNHRGVRIKLPVFPFYKAYNIKQQDLPITISNTYPFKSYIAAEHFYNDRYCIPGIDFEKYLVEVNYTDDENLLKPKVLRNGNGTAVILSELGKYKRKIWSKQTEWRYTFPIFPMTREMIRVVKQPGGADKFGVLMLEAMAKEQDPGIQHIDIPLSPSIIESIQITLGPRITESDRIIVSSLIKEFASNAKLIESSLAGQIV
jgi:hypothetical protein